MIVVIPYGKNEGIVKSFTSWGLRSNPQRVEDFTIPSFVPYGITIPFALQHVRCNIFSQPLDLLIWHIYNYTIHVQNYDIMMLQNKKIVIFAAPPPIAEIGHFAPSPNRSWGRKILPAPKAPVESWRFFHLENEVYLMKIAFGNENFENFSPPAGYFFIQHF